MMGMLQEAVTEVSRPLCKEIENRRPHRVHLLGVLMSCPSRVIHLILLRTGGGGAVLGLAVV